jgi:ubiquinone/menaquinone biosynthesis C-methylase UbiE
VSHYLKDIQDVGIAKSNKVLSTLMITIVLEEILRDQNTDPYPELLKCFNNNIKFLQETQRLIPELLPNAEINVLKQVSNQQEHTTELFEQAWITYTDSTYDHSVELIEQRLSLTGLDTNFFRNRQCFDGGCGTGRFAIAMAKLGASEVVAVDIGGESLEYMTSVVQRHGLTNIQIIQQDITDLSDWSDESFDFVVSNGVLHHTLAPEKGLREHFRITRKDGAFWIYLYGAGGFYWQVYDEIRNVISQINIRDIKRILGGFGIREGLIYTYLDNILAPRTYHYENDVTSVRLRF